MNYSKCDTCGKESEFSDGCKCVDCYEVERRIDKYIRSEAGRNKLLTLLFADHLRRTVPAQSEAYQQGYSSYPYIESIPYKMGSPEHIQFNQGWNDARIHEGNR